MSLRTFHAVFITIASSMAVFCALWWVREFATGRQGAVALLYGALAGGVAAALLVYERRFLKTTRELTRS